MKHTGGVALGVVALLLAGCGSSGSSKPASHSSSSTATHTAAGATTANAAAKATFIRDFNDGAPSDDLKATSAADRAQLTNLGEDFCIGYYEMNDVDKAKRYVIDTDKADERLAGYVEVAATKEKSLCPVK